MSFNFNKYLAITATLLCFSNSSYASSVISCGSGSYDYGDATISSNGTQYGTACHDTNGWQQLGETGDGPVTNGSDAQTTNDGWNAETSQNAVDSGDNGVTWKVQNSDGTWPADFGNGDLVAGANVEFKFIFERSVSGNHQFDQLKAWTDWNGDGVFDDNEEIIDETWYKNENSSGVVEANGGWNADIGDYNNTDTQRIYLTSFQIPEYAVISDTWIRARITCENSLTHANDYTLSSVGYYHQGEVEDYQVSINQVPEPTTILLFGSALFGLMLKRKKSA